jgi:hypothetical protein
MRTIVEYPPNKFQLIVCALMAAVTGDARILDACYLL